MAKSSAAKDKKKSKAPSGPLVGASFGGLSRSRMASGQTFSKRLRFDKKKSSLVQFWAEPDDGEAFKEYSVHSFKEDGNWKFVPCSGDNCPLDTDEDDEKRKKKYRFAAQIFDHADGEPKIMEGPKDLAQRIFSKYEKLVEKGRGDRFSRMVWEVSQLPTVPVSYEVDTTEESAKKLSKFEPASIQEYIDGEIQRYHGDAKPKKSSLVARDEDDADEAPKKSKKSKGKTEKVRTKAKVKDKAKAKKDTTRPVRDGKPSSRTSKSSTRSSSARRPTRR